MEAQLPMASNRVIHHNSRATRRSSSTISRNSTASNSNTDKANMDLQQLEDFNTANNRTKTLMLLRATAQHPKPHNTMMQMLLKAMAPLPMDKNLARHIPPSHQVNFLSKDRTAKHHTMQATHKETTKLVQEERQVALKMATVVLWAR